MIIPEKNAAIPWLSNTKASLPSEVFGVKNSIDFVSLRLISRGIGNHRLISCSVIEMTNPPTKKANMTTKVFLRGLFISAAN